MREPIAAIILAGGRSKRFGYPKQLVVADGELVIRRIARSARTAGLNVYISVADSLQGEVYNKLSAPYSLGYVVDARGFGCGGPALAMYSALSLDYEIYQFVPGDAAWLNPLVVERLVEHGWKLAPVSLPVWWNGRLETLYLSSIRNSLERLGIICQVKKEVKIRASDVPRSSEEIGLIPVSFLLRGIPDDKPMLNVNTRQDYYYPTRRGLRGPLAGPMVKETEEAASHYWEALERLREGDYAGALREYTLEAEELLRRNLPGLAVHALADAARLAETENRELADRLWIRVNDLYEAMDSGLYRMW